jgi:hypothetical protein
MEAKFYREGAKDAKESLFHGFEQTERTFSFPSRPLRLCGSKVLVQACPGQVLKHKGGCHGKDRCVRRIVWGTDNGV